MPIIRILPSHRAVRGIYEYITRKDKTSSDYIFASGCSLDHPEEDFKDMADYFQKDTNERNRTYYHVIVSFNTKNERISPEEVQKMAEELCEKTEISNYQWFAAVHYKDRPIHSHCHIIVNNVAYKDSDDKKIKAGKSFQATRDFTCRLMEKGNQICKEHGYEHSLVNPGRRANERFARAEVALMTKGEVPWKDRLRRSIQRAERKAQSVDEFCYIMQDDYGVEVKTDRKGCFLYIPEEFHKNDTRKMKPCHQRRLGELYSKESIERTIELRKEKRENARQQRENKTMHTKKREWDYER